MLKIESPEKFKGQSSIALDSSTVLGLFNRNKSYKKLQTFDNLQGSSTTQDYHPMGKKVIKFPIENVIKFFQNHQKFKFIQNCGDFTYKFCSSSPELNHSREFWPDSIASLRFPPKTIDFLPSLTFSAAFMIRMSIKKAEKFLIHESSTKKASTHIYE